MLELDRINTHYGQAHILHDVTLSVGQSNVIALLGRNGAGKSTTLKTIAGLVRPTSGTIAFNARAIEGKRPYVIARAGIGYVPEERRIFASLSVLENLETGRKPRLHDTAEWTGVEWTAERVFEIFPNLGRMRKRLAGQMSGGEQQMLTIGRTLMGNPSLLLLDEPSEGLAPVIVEQMAASIRALKADGLTVVLSEQNLRFASALADRAAIIEKGTIRYEGSMNEIANDDSMRAQYLALGA
ncbi:MAG: ABC transporter ATP-binding protein [Gammaproteobacteria bacterium]